MMMQYNPKTVSATCGVYSMSVQHFLGVIQVPQPLLPLSAVYYTELSFQFIAKIFQVLSQVPFMKGKMRPFGNLTENNYNNHQLVM